MKKIVIIRTKEYRDQQTIGYAKVINEEGVKIFDFVVLELPYRDNKRNISCIPPGTYPLKLEHSPKFNMLLWEAKDVPGRSECKFHAANYKHQLNGCFAPGLYFKDLNGDGFPDVVASYSALMGIHRAMGNDTEAILKVIQIF